MDHQDSGQEQSARYYDRHLLTQSSEPVKRDMMSENVWDEREKGLEFIKNPVVAEFSGYSRMRISRA